MKIPSVLEKQWWKVVTSEKHGDTFYIEASIISFTSEYIIADGVNIRILGGSVLEVIPSETQFE